MRLYELFAFRVKPKSAEEWKDFMEDIKEKVLDAVRYFCWNIYGGTAYECLSSHSTRDIDELVEEFIGMNDITEEDLEMVRKMPPALFDELTRQVQKELEEDVREIERRYPEVLREVE